MKTVSTNLSNIAEESHNTDYGNRLIPESALDKKILKALVYGAVKSVYMEMPVKTIHSSDPIANASVGVESLDFNEHGIATGLLFIHEVNYDPMFDPLTICDPSTFEIIFWIVDTQNAPVVMWEIKKCQLSHSNQSNFLPYKPVLYVQS